MPKPAIGRIVHYTLTAQDAEQINRRRADMQTRDEQGQRLVDRHTGAVIHQGNGVREGEVYPLVITRVWHDQRLARGEARSDTPVNGQVLLDGNDTLWVTSRIPGDGPGSYAWPVVK